jgi:hypothetical protein
LVLLLLRFLLDYLVVDLLAVYFLLLQLHLVDILMKILHLILLLKKVLRVLVQYHFLLYLHLLM